MAKGIEYFIARRTSRKQSSAEGGAMLPIATLSVALSIAVMVITIAVILGFKEEVHSKLTSLSGQIVLSSASGGNSFSPSAIKRSDKVRSIADLAAAKCGTKITRISSIATHPAIVRTPQSIEGVLLKGVDSSYNTAIFESGLIEGEVPKFGGDKSSRNVIIAKELANSCKLSIGDKLELLITDQNSNMRRDLYRVGAIYSSGLGEAEKMIIITDIHNVQRLNRWGEDEISSYEIWLSQLDLAPLVAQQLNSDIIYTTSDDLDSVVAYDIQRLYPSIFDWLAAHDINALVIIVIMMVVAIFNIITALLILVLERTQLIGMLKVLGMNDMAIRKIFLYRAMGITLKGLAYGNGAAILFCLIQQKYHLLKLDEAGYILSSVPINLSLGWIMLLNIGVAMVILLLIIIPTKMIGQIEPSRAIKFQ